MSLTGFHTTWISDGATYKDDRDFLLKVAENNILQTGGSKGLTPYFDGSIAIGYGFDPLRNPISYVEHFLGTIGITLTDAQRKQIVDARSSPSDATAATLGKFLNLGGWASGEPRAELLLRNVLDSTDVNFLGKEFELDTFFNDHQIYLPESREKAVLVSMWYQAAGGAQSHKNGYFRNAKDEPTETVKALKAGDRAEVWYQIRYDSNGNRLPGIAVRRYFEADYFGLYGDGTTSANMPDGDAKGALRTWTRHKNAILKYEATWGVSPDGTIGSRGNRIQEAKTTYDSNLVGQLDEDLLPAATYLIKTYIDDKGITLNVDWQNIQVGENDGSNGTANTLYYRGTDSDVLIGTTESDLLFGESGADVLQGGGGDDVLYGGQGLDTYLYTPGDGNDTIIDDDAQGVIAFGSDRHLLSLGLHEASDPIGQYHSRDNTLTYTITGPDLAIQNTTTGETITVKHFQQANNDLHLHLVDLPIDPPPEAQMYTPPTFDATGLQTNGTDQEDTLTGTLGAEVLHGLNSNDTIDGHGGNDRLYGDAGDDRIYTYASGTPNADNVYADGGAGNDVIWADDSVGDDHLVGGANDATDGKDLIISAWGNDYLQGGGGNDVLADYAGTDVLDGGAGDDYLFGNTLIVSVDTTWDIQAVGEVIGGMRIVDHATAMRR